MVGESINSLRNPIFNFDWFLVTKCVKLEAISMQSKI